MQGASPPDARVLRSAPHLRRRPSTTRRRVREDEYDPEWLVRIAQHFWGTLNVTAEPFRVPLDTGERD